MACCNSMPETYEMMPNSASHDGNYLRRPPILKADQEMSEHNTRRLTEVERAVLWEVDMARQCVHNFGKMSSAHSIILSLLVTVNLIGFLQPPKGWAPGDAGGEHPNLREVSIMYNTRSVRCFSITNALSVYSAITGLLFYIYCSYTSILPLGTFPLPMGGTGDMYDERAIESLHQTCAFLRCIILPSILRRSHFHFSFLILSLVFSGIAFVSAGTAAVGPLDHVLVSIVVPLVPGCICVFISLGLAVRKYRKELQFDTRFDFFWTNMARIDEKCIPGLVPIGPDDFSALDPIPFRWATMFISPYECKDRRHPHPSHKHMQAARSPGH